MLNQLFSYMEIFLGWLCLSLFVGLFGANRKIGFGGAFVLSLIFSPLIGFIVTIVSKTLTQVESDEKILEVANEQLDVLSQLKDNNVLSVADEIEKLRKLKEDGLIDDEEFRVLKNKLINT